MVRYMNGNEEKKYALLLEEGENHKVELLSSVAKTPDEKIRILLLETRILTWAKGGDISDQEAKVYFDILYRELKKIRYRSPPTIL